MDKRTLTVKGVLVEASSHPFVHNFHYTAVTKPITIVDAETAALKAVKTSIKRPAKPLEEDNTEKKPATQPLIEPKITETVEEVRKRVIARFELPSCLVSPVTVLPVPDPPKPVETPAPTTTLDLSSADKFLQVLDCLNNLQAFNRAQAEFLARHGLTKYMEDLSKLTVWDAGYPKSNRRFPTSVHPSSNGNAPHRKRPKGHWGGYNVEEFLRTLELHRPPCYSGSYRLVKQLRPMSSRDMSLREYLTDRIVLPGEGEDVGTSA